MVIFNYVYNIYLIKNKNKIKITEHLHQNKYILYNI